MRRRVLAVSLAAIALVVAIGPRGGGVSAVETPDPEVAGPTAALLDEVDVDTDPNDGSHIRLRAPALLPTSPDRGLASPDRSEPSGRPVPEVLPRPPLHSAHSDRGPPPPGAPI